MYEKDITRLENVIKNANGLTKENEKNLIQLVENVLSKDYSGLNEKEKIRVKLEVRMQIKEIQGHIRQLEQKYSPDIAAQIERELIFIIDRSYA